MSEAEHTHRLKDDAKLQPRGYYMRVDFAPSISMRRKVGIQFAEKISEYLNLDETTTRDTEWRYLHRREGTDSKVQFSVEQNNVQAQAHFPTDAKEWFEERFRFFFREFRNQFTPQFILSSSVMIRGELDVDGDARTFLANHAINVKPGQFGRPIHGMGLRLFFPPYQLKPKSKRGKATTVEWQINVKIESLLEDPGKLFLEADADWNFPKEWNDKQIDLVILHLEDVSSFLDKTIIPYLCNSKTGDSDGENDGDDHT